MSWDIQRQAEALMEEADRFTRSGKLFDAAESNFKAAEAEMAVYRGLPKEDDYTRGVIAVGAAVLLYRAGRYRDCIVWSHSCLADAAIDTQHQFELEDIILDSRQILDAEARGEKVGRVSVEVALSGPGVGYGYASTELVAEKLDQISKLFIRVGEWDKNRPLRRRGAVSAEIRAECTPLLTSTRPGSFRLALRLPDPDPGKPVLPIIDGMEQSDRFVKSFFNICEAAASERPEEFTSLVSQEDYRIAFAQQLRDIAPDGKELDTVRITQREAGRDTSVVLTESTRFAISSLVHVAPAPLAIPQAIPQELVGVLRAIDLDRAFLGVKDDEGREHVCYFGNAVILDDVVGPYVNKRVRVPGLLQTDPAGDTRFTLTDIELVV